MKKQYIQLDDVTYYTLAYVKKEANVSEQVLLRWIKKGELNTIVTLYWIKHQHFIKKGLPHPQDKRSNHKGCICYQHYRKDKK